MAKQYMVSSLISFQHKFATEQACIEYLAGLRYTDGWAGYIKPEKEFMHEPYRPG